MLKWYFIMYVLSGVFEIGHIIFRNLKRFLGIHKQDTF